MSAEDDYTAKVQELERAKQEVQALVNAVLGADPRFEYADKLRNWRNLQITNIPEGNSWTATRGRLPPAISGWLWPPAAKIGKALTAYDNALLAAQRAWRALPVDDRALTSQPVP
jgi:hypothetical protein